MLEETSKVNGVRLIDLLDFWGIDLRGGYSAPVRVLRHAGDDGAAHMFYQLGAEEFEWYQGSQSRRVFGDAKILISFIGTEGNEASFVGAYRVCGLLEGRIDPPFARTVSSELIKKCDVRYHYQLERVTEFDQFRDRLRIAWDSPAIAWIQGFPKCNKEITAIRTNAGEWVVPQSRELVPTLGILPTQENSYSYDFGSYKEGERSLRIHLAIERNPALVRDAKARFKETHNGCLYCQACAFNFKRVYGEDYIECHHSIPVHKLPSDGSTRIEDVVLLCSNCHRMIHRRKEWMTLEQLRTRLGRLNYK